MEVSGETRCYGRGMASAPRIFDRQHRTLTFGILLGITLVAFEALAVVTIAPRFANELGGADLYGWVFSALLLTSLLGTVIGGSQSDVRGPGPVILGGLVMFGLGLAVGGAAPNMPVLIAGRLLQGLGGGALVTALFAVVNLAYSDALRPSLFAAMSSAWVVPGLVGPLLAAFAADAFGWRVVFWGLLPLLGVVAFLTVPAFGRFPKPEGSSGPSRLLQAFGLAAGTGLCLFGLTLLTMWGFLLAVVGGVLAFLNLRTFTPAGTLTARRGLPATLASRALFYSLFAGVEAFLAYMLTRVHGLPETVAGAVIATGALSWASGSFLQSRLDKRGLGTPGRARRVRFGTLLLSAGLSVQLVALFSPVLALPISLVGWATAGLGIGLAHSTVSVLAFAAAPEGEGGTVSASLQLADQFSSAVATGVGGALLALSARLGYAEQVGVAWAFSFCLVLIFGAVWVAGRLLGTAGREAPKVVPVEG